MSHTKKKEIIYSADQALKNPAQDKFNRASFAERISGILISKQYTTPLVIGIYGKWGEGKTSVVNFIKFYLQKNDEDNEIVYLNFNPWRFNDEDELLDSFFKQFSQGISQKLGKIGKKVAKEMLTYSGLILALAEPITGLSFLTHSNKFSKFISKIFGNDFESTLNRLQSSLEKSTTIDKQKEVINNKLKDTGKVHAIFIDDIDRLNKNEIQILFKLIKLTADFENVIYVLSFDPTIVASALSETYPGNEKESGFKFLEKIVQVPLELPKIRRTDLLNDVLFPGIENILNNKAIKLTEDEERDIADALMNNFNSRLSTPRMAKKYINALNFSIPLLKNEVNTFDLILIEGLRICYPDVYGFIYSNKNLFIQDTGKSLYPKQKDIDEEQKKSRQEFLEDKPSEATKIVGSLFPKADSNFSLLSSVNDASKHKSISSPHYFDRYFSYSVAKYDIRDSDFENLIHNFSNSNEELQLA